MSAPAGYSQIPATGEYMKDSDGSGPYVFSGTVMALVGSGGGGGGGGAITAAAGAIADGADVTEGALADAAVTAGAAGSVSAKLRAISRDIASPPATRQIDVALADTLNAVITVLMDAGTADIGFDIFGLATLGATLTVESSNNVGAITPRWSAINAVKGSTLSSTITADGAYRVEAGGRTAVRLRVSTAGTAGNITVSTTTSQAGSLVTLAAALPVGTVTRTDKSGTITTGGTAQNAIAANTLRKGWELQNTSSGDLWFNTLAVAVVGQPSFKLSPGQTYQTDMGFADTGAVSLIGATTGQTFAARELT